MRSGLLLRAFVVLAPLALLAGCSCCPKSATDAGLPARVHMDDAHPQPAR